MTLLKVLAHTPDWLGPGSSGGSLFSPEADGDIAPQNKGAPSIAPKTVAYKGSHLYVAVGNTIRWADLRDLKDGNNSWARSSTSRASLNGPNTDLSLVKHKTLETKIPDRILHISISPSEDYMAVATTAGLYAVILPESSHLYWNTPVIPATTYRVGSNVHNDSRCAITSLLWHPLGHKGSCLVTITADAILRLWEFDAALKSSFMMATTTLSLVQLVEAAEVEDVLEGPPASDYIAGYFASPDMIPVAASFGSPDLNSGCWSAMTLWVTMSSGYVYSLCPLLPTKWEAPLSILTSVHSYIQATSGDEADEEIFMRESTEALLKWYNSLEDQFSKASRKPGFDPESCVLLRPSNPLLPAIQGPFVGTHEADPDVQMVDMMVMPLISPGNLDSYGTPIFDIPSPVVSHVVSVSSSFGKIYHMLDLCSAVPKWLPSRNNGEYQIPDGGGTLLTIEVIDEIFPEAQTTGLTSTIYFCRDWLIDYTFFVTNDTGILQISSSYLSQFAKELADLSQDNIDERLEFLMSSTTSDCQHASRITTERFSSTTCLSSVSVGVVIQAMGLGLFVLSVLGNHAIAATLRLPQDELLLDEEDDDPVDIQLISEAENGGLDLAREAYIPPARLLTPFAFERFIASRMDSRLQKQLREEVSMSTYMMDFMIDAHRVMAQDTLEFRQSVSHLFPHCALQQNDFKNILKAYRRAAQEIEALGEVTHGSTSILDRDRDDPPVSSSIPGSSSTPSELAVGIDGRFNAVVARQKAIHKRTEALLSKVAHLAGRQVSSKEKAWMEDIRKMAGLFGLSADDVDVKVKEENGETEKEKEQEGQEPKLSQTSLSSLTADPGTNSKNLDRVKSVMSIAKDLKSESDDVLKKMECLTSSSSFSSPSSGAAATPRSSKFLPPVSSPYSSPFRSSLGPSSGARLTGSGPVLAHDIAIKKMKEARIQEKMEQLSATVDAMSELMNKLKLEVA